MSRPVFEMPDLTSRRSKMHYVTALNELARMGVDATTVDILAVGDFWNYRGEVHAQHPAPGTTVGPDTPISLEVGSPSAVDILPHQFFVGLEHRPSTGRRWEDQARRLMAPFDAAVIRHDAWALYKILKVSFGYFDRAHLRRFLEKFGIPEPAVTLTDRELLLVAMLLPALHEWGGNAEAVSAVIELFFGFSVEIQESIPRKFDIPPRLRYKLGSREGRLGASSVLGTSFVECESTYRITLRGVDFKSLPEFLPGRPMRQKFDWLLHLVAPNNLEYELRLLPYNRTTKLGDRGGSYLGYATFVRTQQ